MQEMSQQGLLGNIKSTTASSTSLDIMANMIVNILAIFSSSSAQQPRSPVNAPF